MFCRFCGKHIPDGACFCSSCGGKIRDSDLNSHIENEKNKGKKPSKITDIKDQLSEIGEFAGAIVLLLFLLGFLNKPISSLIKFIF